MFPQGYWDGYDENVNPNIIDAFSGAAFRIGHTFLPTTIERWSKAHKFIGKVFTEYLLNSEETKSMLERKLGKWKW